MEVAMPMVGASTVAAMDCYEDMFKEITRKLYGEDGLPDLTSGERLTGITTSAERGLTGIDYDVEPPIFKPEEHITAFGLAALMQNGFPPAGILNSSFQQPKQGSALEDKWINNEDNLQWTQSKIASYNPSQKLFKCADCDCVGFLMRVAEHWLGTHANLRVFQCPQCPYASAWARCVRMHLVRQHNINTEEMADNFLKENPVLHEITRYLQKLKTKYETSCSKLPASQSNVSEEFIPNAQSSSISQRLNNSSNGSATETDNSGGSSNSGGSGSVKRYSCSYCPYSTDRRDLFTRHENIHREEKPFQCYVCQKQFNRADHVKKHFLRMHREHPYDLNRIRRHPPKNASGMSYYTKYNGSGSTSTSSSLEPIGNVQHNLQHQLTIPNGFGAMVRVGQSLPHVKSSSPQPSKPSNVKTNSLSKSSSKKKGDKRYSCCYCSWSGVDNWCLKRHLNTHLKPFVCGLCDYKAARSERLATHVLKVHNKRACGRCLFLADDQVQLMTHQQEHHPLEQRNRSNNVLRNSSFNTSINPSNQPFGHNQSLNSVGSGLKPYELSAAAAILQHGRGLLPMTGNIISNTETKPWKPYTPKQHGAARLFNYMEASDGSEPECDTTSNTVDMERMPTNHRNQSDFPEAGDVGNQNQGEFQEDYDAEIELPLFICRECGCEFIDDISLETHQYTHHDMEKISTSPVNHKLNKINTLAKKNAAKNTFLEKINIDSKENLNPKLNYNCFICKLSFSCQTSIMNHMKSHITINSTVEEKKLLPLSNQKKSECGGEAALGADSNGLGQCYQDIQNLNGTCKRSRKQSQPRKVVPPFCENNEIQVVKGVSSKHIIQNSGDTNIITKLRDKYMLQLLNRKGINCNLCKKRKSMFPFHTKGSLALHYIWRHTYTKPFECEHCGARFRHQYQVVLHSSREHVKSPAKHAAELAGLPALGHQQVSSTGSSMQMSTDKQRVPKPMNKEPIIHSVSVPVSESFQTVNSLLTTNVPDNSINSSSVDKLDLQNSYMEHSLIHNSTTTNNHMPIIIPTFPPS